MERLHGIMFISFTSTLVFAKASTGTARKIPARSAWICRPEPVAQDIKEVRRLQSEGAVQAQKS
jgi:hypothetical protein